ncbi:preprotein translocase subunit YajC [Gordonia sp. NPDC003504]
MTESLFLPLLLVLMVGFMVFSMRKQKKRAAEMQDMQNSVQTGTRIQLSSGLFGTVIDATSSDYVDVEIATGLVTRWNRLAVMRVVPTDEAAATYPGYVPPFALEDDDDHDLDDAVADDTTSDTPNLNKSSDDKSADSEK